ncbi:MAG: sulfate adenylyltransferase [Campylobacterales bacterium]
MGFPGNRRRGSLWIDREAYITLAMVQAGYLFPIDKLMNRREAEIADREKKYRGKPVPFSFILAPAGRRNRQVLEQRPEVLDFYTGGEKVGEIEVEEIYPIDPLKRVEVIYGTKDSESYPQVARTLKRLGRLAVAGRFWVRDSVYSRIIEQVREESGKVESVAGMTLHGKPIHRVHERIMRLMVERNDLLILFLIKNLDEDEMPYSLRLEILTDLIEHYFPKERVRIVPLQNTYIFSGVNEAILEAIIARNFGCTRFIIGQTHSGLGIYYEADHLKSIFDSMDLGIEIEVVQEYVYCNICKTIVSTKSCPHGSHHHISYHSDSIFELIKTGLLPPPILMRKEISAKILAHLFPNRFKNLEKLFYDIAPSKGLIEEQKGEEQFYISLMKLYQTSSLK